MHIAVAWTQLSSKVSKSFRSRDCPWSFSNIKGIPKYFTEFEFYKVFIFTWSFLFYTIKSARNILSNTVSNKFLLVKIYWKLQNQEIWSSNKMWDPWGCITPNNKKECSYFLGFLLYYLVLEFLSVHSGYWQIFSLITNLFLIS